MSIEELTRESPVHREIFLEVDRYIYSGGLAGSLTLWGHWSCARLRQFDLVGCTVLDLGCGPGHHFRFVKKANILGIDNMPEMVEKAREAAEIYEGRCRIIEGDIFDIPLEDDSVDSVICSGVFEHLIPLDKALRETERVLRPGGELILLQPCEGFLFELGRKLTTGRHIVRKMGIDYQKYLDTEHVHKCGDLLNQVGEIFRFDKMVGIPSMVPVISINAFVAVRFVRK